MNVEQRSRFPYHGWPAEAVDLVERAILRHGGTDLWHRLEAISLDPRFLRGPLPALKGHGRTFGLPSSFEIRPHRKTVIFRNFPDGDHDGLYEDGTVSIVERITSETMIGSVDHRKTFRGRAKHRRWLPLDALYFFGYALVHYHSVPFVLGGAGFVGQRVVRSRGETLSALEVEFPEGSHTHSRRETLFFADTGLIRRHDYTAEVVSSIAHGCHYSDDYEIFEGMAIAMRRTIVASMLGRPTIIPVLAAEFRDATLETNDPESRTDA